MSNIKNLQQKIDQLKAEIRTAQNPLQAAQLEMAGHLNAWHTGQVGSKDATRSSEMKVEPLSGVLTRLKAKLASAQKDLDDEKVELRKNGLLADEGAP